MGEGDYLENMSSQFIQFPETAKLHLYQDYHADVDITERDTVVLWSGEQQGASPGEQDIGFPPSPSIFWTPTQSLREDVLPNRSINSIELEQSQAVVHLALPLLKPMCNYSTVKNSCLLSETKSAKYQTFLTFRWQILHWMCRTKFLGQPFASLPEGSPGNVKLSDKQIKARADVERYHRMLNLTIQLPL